jgi:protein-S-isoprenylcysteine O-methyltransferase Ste14
LTDTLALAHLALMGKIRRAVNLIIALTLVALGCGGLFYFYFVATTWNRGLAVAAGIVAFAGFYWLWDEHINPGPPGEP